MGHIEENIHRINEEKNQIATSIGKKKDEVLLVAVTKTRTAEEINEAILAGITDVGENKVQEIMDKYDHVNPVRWHLIGHLQTNKVKYIIDKVSMIHSVDSFKLAQEIDKRAGEHNITMDILIQINAAEEESKFGITKEETEALIFEILEKCPNVRIRGLMHIAPFAENPEAVRVYFRQIKELYDKYGEIQHPHLDFKYLSMGMSHDFEIAILEGANLIRVGTSIFGERDYGQKK